MALYIGFLDLDRLGHDREGAAFGHGVVRVHDQVHENLLEHTDVAFDEQKSGWRLKL